MRDQRTGLTQDEGREHARADCDRQLYEIVINAPHERPWRTIEQEAAREIARRWASAMWVA